MVECCKGLLAHMGLVRFDGSAAAMVKQSGLSGLRAYRPKSPKKPALADVDRLHLINKDDHKSMPRYAYYECARMHETQAAVTMGNVHQLEAGEDLTPVTKKKIVKLRELYKKQLASAREARQLGYARRSVLHHWFACKIPKDHRAHFTISLTLIGFGINIIWFVYIAYLIMQRRKAKAHDSKKDSSSSGGM